VLLPLWAIWPSGLRRQNQDLVRKGEGSNPSVVKRFAVVLSHYARAFEEQRNDPTVATGLEEHAPDSYPQFHPGTLVGCRRNAAGRLALVHTERLRIGDHYNDSSSFGMSLSSNWPSKLSLPLPHPGRYINLSNNNSFNGVEAFLCTAFQSPIQLGRPI
jgi:hypothetical protein